MWMHTAALRKVPQWRACPLQLEVQNDTDLGSFPNILGRHSDGPSQWLNLGRHSDGIRLCIAAQPNYLCGQAPQLKPLALKTWRGKNRAKENAGDKTSHPWKGRASFAIQCFRLSFSDWLSISGIFLPIHNSVGRRNMSHQVPSTDRVNTITSTTSQKM